MREFCVEERWTLITGNSFKFSICSVVAINKQKIISRLVNGGTELGLRGSKCGR